MCSCRSQLDQKSRPPDDRWSCPRWTSWGCELAGILDGIAVSSCHSGFFYFSVHSTLPFVKLSGHHCPHFVGDFDGCNDCHHSLFPKKFSNVGYCDFGSFLATRTHFHVVIFSQRNLGERWIFVKSVSQNRQSHCWLDVRYWKQIKNQLISNLVWRTCHLETEMIEPDWLCRKLLTNESAWNWRHFDRLFWKAGLANDLFFVIVFINLAGKPKFSLCGKPSFLAKLTHKFAFLGTERSSWDLM